MNSIIEELKKHYEINQRLDKDIPRPIYLYNASYGRSLEPYMEEIAKLYGESKFLLYKTIFKKDKQTLLDSFLLEIERNIDFGSSFKGVVFIHFADSIKKEDALGLLEYLSTRQEEIIPVFSMDCERNVDFVKDLLQNFYFIRYVKAEEYTVEEQMDIITGRLADYQCTLEEAAAEYLKEYFKDKDWDEDDVVESHLVGLTDSLVFEGLLDSNEKKTMITLQALKEKLDEKPGEKAAKKIGF